MNFVIFYVVVEICEIIVIDLSLLLVNVWIEYVIDIYKVLYFFLFGINRKDVFIRFLEWIDVGVVYYKNGVVGFLRYVVVLVLGGDVYIILINILVLDFLDMENVVGDFLSEFDVNVVDSLFGKFVFEKFFDGVVFRDFFVV